MWIQTVSFSDRHQSFCVSLSIFKVWSKTPRSLGVINYVSRISGVIKTGICFTTHLLKHLLVNEIILIASVIFLLWRYYAYYALSYAAPPYAYILAKKGANGAGPPPG